MSSSFFFIPSGCFFQNASLFCVSKPETIHGMIFQFSYAELEQATNKFSSNSVVGHGGSSCVYRGQLKDGKTAAIKRLNAPKGDDNDTLFTTEVYKPNLLLLLLGKDTCGDDPIYVFLG